MFTIYRQKRIAAFLAVLLIVACVGCGRAAVPSATPSPEQIVIVSETTAPTAATTPLPPPQLRYIFLFIGDGMGYAQVQAAEDALAAAGRESLCFTNFPIAGSAHTANVDGEVTDSAAAATAIATGKKTVNGYLGLDESQNRLIDLSETLRDTGKKIGILTTVSLDHATPAGFYAHVDSRRSYAMIADDLFASGFDFFAGGGFHDTPDAAQRAAENGYALIHSFEEAPAGGGSLILSSSLIFGDYGVLPAIDGGAREDWLKKATELAIARLTDPTGFFMMVEGGRIDYFCHYNDAGSFIAELLDFDEAVQSALAFYEQHPSETLIVVTADHETGLVSFTEGDRAALLRQTISCDLCDDTLVAACVSAQTPFEEALPLFLSAFGLSDLTAEETAYLETAYAHTLKGDLPGSTANEEYGVYDPITSACAALVAARAGLVFGSGAHSALDVPVYAIGPGSEFFAGTYENTALHDAFLQATAAYPVP
ncbi:MAG: alkaline phosphatase [Clostridiales bacterium]|nr:alkaline phosphatase [Clostridiales bacterium]